jgi:hypothetical protein
MSSAHVSQYFCKSLYYVPFTYLNFTYAFNFNGGLWWCVGGLDPLGLNACAWALGIMLTWL